MPMVKKISPTWAPAENPSLAVGAEIFIDDIKTLVEEGKVEVVKKKK